LNVLLSREAFDRFCPILTFGDNETTWLCLEDDSTVRNGKTGDAVPQPIADVAWASTDILYAPTRDDFFELVREQRTVQWLQSGFAGLDLPIIGDLLARGATVTNSHANSLSIAEYVLGAILRAYQRPDKWSSAQSTGRWSHHEFREIYGTLWLVIGLGSIGSAIATRAAAFGATVVGVRRHPGENEFVARQITPAQLFDVLPDADVVVLTLPSTPETFHLVDREFLSKMAMGSVLVNVARGALVDESALLESLAEGKPGTAILDVFETEPLPATSPLWSHPNVVVTPHASSAGLGRHERNARLFRDNFDRFRTGLPLANQVTLEAFQSGQIASDSPAQFGSAGGKPRV
jgi:phosphoglycerate dehydrogenase-like enzyme